MLALTLLAIGLIIAFLLGYAARRPNRFVVRRSALIKASPEKLHALISDLRRWTLWSPWEGLDPTMTRSYDGPAQGVGARYAWAGNRKVGQGRMEITASTPSQSVALRLEFLKPFAATNAVEFLLVPREDLTAVSWTMEGPDPYLSRVIKLFVNLEGMIGKDFERGLAQLKRLAEM